MVPAGCDASSTSNMASWRLWLVALAKGLDRIDADPLEGVEHFPLGHFDADGQSLDGIALAARLVTDAVQGAPQVVRHLQHFAREIGNGIG